MGKKSSIQPIYTQFELDIAQIYRDLGASVEHDKNIDGLQVDVYAIQNTPDGSQIKTGIECKQYNRPLGINDVVAICERLGSIRASGSIDKGVIVSNDGFTHDARAHCESKRIECFVPLDLRRRIADFSKYLQGLRDKYHELEVAEKDLFIALSAKTESGQDIPDVIEFLDKWLDEPGQILTLLGEYGSGKTTSSWYFAQQLAREHLESGGHGRIPILIALRDFGPNFNLRGYLTDFLINQQDLNIHSYSTFEKLNKEGRLLLIFDAFDEMAIRADIGLITRNFDDILSLAQNKAKIIITCRTSFFKDQNDLERLYMGTHLYDMLHKHEAYRVIFLKGFSSEQIQEYLFRFYGDDWIRFYRALSAKEKLISLADRPILMNMIASTTSSAGYLLNINSAVLYEKYVDLWMKRDDWRCKLTPEQRMQISQALAFEVITKRRSTIQHKELITLIPGYLGNNYKSDMLDQFEYEVRTSTFLRNDLQGFYSFVHKSFAEFLAAKYVLDQIMKGNISTITESLTSETINFLSELVANQRELYLPSFWDCLNTKDNNAIAETGKKRAIAALIIGHCGGDLSGVDLSYAIFPDNASMQSAILRDAILVGVEGKELDFTGADFLGADLRKSCLTHCIFKFSDLEGANLEESNLTGSTFTGANLKSASFRRANLYQIQITPDDEISVLEKLGIEATLKALEQVKSIPNANDILYGLIADKLNSNQSTLFLRALSYVWNWGSNQDIKILSNELSLCVESITTGMPLVYRAYDIGLLNIDKEIKTYSPGKLEVTEFRTKRDLEIKKRKLRREYRELRIKIELILNQFTKIMDSVSGYLESISELKSGAKKLSPKVQKTIFANSRKLSKVQSAWLQRRGAIIRINN